ncbi:TIGR02285 family protein [Desulfomicrobium escambiense]|uniref:TIGR02285 family protein n=1 Tax=Desulfomicrobium escambiense TaxID=29503 RepID=UPI0004197040|nr:TIGR02285 family protein [Desulfomicrobium escambiense]
MLLLVCLGLPWACPAAEVAANAVTWMHADFPPLRIVDGPYAGQGPSDMIHGLMRCEMPDLDHHVLTANLSRTMNWMQKGEKVLAVGIIPNPERDACMQYSIPCVLVPPACLVVRADDAGNAQGGRVALREFVARKVLGVAVDRSYGPEVDTVLRTAPDQPRIVAHTGSNLLGSLLDMLLRGRVDGVLAYPFEATYVARMKGRERDIALVPLKEALVPVVGRIAAPRTAWGSDMIVRVNAVLQRHRGTQEYRQAFERWLPAGAVEDYRAMYDEFLLAK